MAFNSKFPAIAAFSGIFGKQQLSLQRISFCSRRVKLTRQGWESAPGFKDKFHHS